MVSSGRNLDEVLGIKDRMKNIWFDCDLAIGLLGKDPDDAFALATLLLPQNQFKVLGLSLVFGNTNLFGFASKQIEKIQRFSNINIPIFPGARFSSDITKGIGHTHIAAEEMIKALKKHKVTFILAGPSTNLSQALKMSPEIAGNIEEIIVIGGRWQGKIAELGPKRTRFPDKNFDWDISAFAVLVQENIPITFICLESLKNQFWSSSDLQRLARSSSVGKWLARRTYYWLLVWKVLFGASGFLPWDIFLVAYIKYPQYFKTQAARIQLGIHKNQSSWPMSWMWPQKVLPVVDLFPTEIGNVKAILEIDGNLKERILREFETKNSLIE